MGISTLFVILEPKIKDVWAQKNEISPYFEVKTSLTKYNMFEKDFVSFYLINL